MGAINLFIRPQHHHIIVKSLYKIILPTTEEYVTEKGFDSLESYRRYVKNMLLLEKEQILLEKSVESIIDIIIEDSVFDINEDTVVDNALKYYYQNKQLVNISNEDVEKESAESMYKECYEESLREIKKILIIGRYAFENEIEVLEEDIEQYCKGKNIVVEKMSERDMILVKYAIIEQKVLQNMNGKFVRIKISEN